nr:MAG TPA: hypothetical protein [Caudoviricetes sp.]
MLAGFKIKPYLCNVKINKQQVKQINKFYYDNN